MLRVGVNCTVQFQYAIAVDLNPKLRELERQGSNWHERGPLFFLRVREVVVTRSLTLFISFQGISSFLVFLINEKKI